MTRFPSYPADILSRADAFLASKYPDGIVDPLLVEVACEAMMVEQDHVAALLKDPAAVRVNYLRGGIACQALIDEATIAEMERAAGIADAQEEINSSGVDDWSSGACSAAATIAKAIRGTE